MVKVSDFYIAIDTIQSNKLCMPWIVELLFKIKKQNYYIWGGRANFRARKILNN